MNKISFIICVFFLHSVVLLSSCKDKAKEQAVIYNDAIVNEIDKADSIIQILFAFDLFERFPQIQSSYNYTFNAAKSNLEKLTPFPGDDSLRIAAIELIQSYTSILNHDYGNIYLIMKDSVYETSDSLTVDSIMFNMFQSWQEKSETIGLIQNRFAKRNEIELIQ